MNKYFYYMVVLNMLLNIMVAVPDILIQHRYSGAFMAMILSAPFGALSAYLFTKTMVAHPEQGLPEIFKTYMPAWIRVSFLLFLAVMWLTAGYIVLNLFTQITLRYINPEASLLMIATLFALLGVWGATRPSFTVLYVMEILIILCSPLIAFILYKAITNEYVRWDAIQVMFDYIIQWPSWTSFTAATYLYIGYLNMAVFN